MKTLRLRMLTLFLLLVGVTVVQGQQRDVEVPGDNFSLEGALELFKKSESPEEFEKLLNAQDSKVNNLDLNGDGYIDYVRVIDRNEGNIHTFTLQAIVADDQVQDVAVIALEKKTNDKAVLQIIGDEDVYGMETIIEPTREVRVNAGTSTATTFVNVWTWPSVQYVYSPYYTVWVSPWSWAVRPIGWHHWHPVVYYRYASWWSPYRTHYARCYSPRIAYASRIYRPYRATSVIVHRRHQTQLAQYRSTHGNEYNRSRSRYNNNDRYSNNTRNEGQRDVRADRPTVRARSNEGTARTRIETRNTKPTDRTIERSNTPVQRERRETKFSERNRSTVKQPGHEQPKHERLSTPRREPTQPRMSSERSNRSSGHATSGASHSRERNKRPR